MTHPSPSRPSHPSPSHPSRPSRAPLLRAPATLAGLAGLAGLCVVALGCSTELRGAEAVAACSTLTSTFCERLAECDGSVNEDTCRDADDALGGPCADATVVELSGAAVDVESCQELIKDLGCRSFDDRTNLDLPCPSEIAFE